MTVPASATERPRVRRDVVSFVRRSARMTAGQARAWQDYSTRWVLDVPRGPTSTSIAADATFDREDAFGRPAGDHPLVVEIGPGMGDSLVPMAQERPEADVLAFEVYAPAVAAVLARLADQGVGNVRLVMADAVDGLTSLLEPATVDEVWTFFPDPWPKVRHHKRRLVDAAFADLVASRLKPGGVWRLATDWADYADAMRTVLDHHPELRTATDDRADQARRIDRPVTRFEQRGRAAGRSITDLTYRRR